MTFAPKHVPLSEALRLVAERCDIKKPLRGIEWVILA